MRKTIPHKTEKNSNSEYDYDYDINQFLYILMKQTNPFSLEKYKRIIQQRMSLRLHRKQ